MKRSNEIVSLNAVPVELQEDLTLDERLDKLTSKELQSLNGGSNVCPKNCPNDYCRDCNAYCDTNCEWHDCPYEAGWIPCAIMGGQT